MAAAEAKAGQQDGQQDAGTKASAEANSGQLAKQQKGQENQQNKSEQNKDGEKSLDIQAQEYHDKLKYPKDVPYREEPEYYPDGRRNQRTVEQEKKQQELIKFNRRQLELDSNRSRSASRRARRKRVERDQRDGKYMHTNSLAALEEAEANNEMKAMQPFERIGPDSTSMDGPVTMARALRGEIPMRGTHPGESYYHTPNPQKEKSMLDEADGLKLSVEANLDIEIELKASIRGDLTLSLMA